MYERPATGFVAGFVGVSNVLEGDVAQAIAGEPHAFTVRPEKISLDDPDARVAPEDCTRNRPRDEVVYLGAVTRYIVDLDRGGALVVMQQNLTTSSMQALQVRGKAVRLCGNRGNNRPVEAPAGASAGSMDQEGEHEEERGCCCSRALSMIAVACGSDTTSGRGCGATHDHRKIGPGEGELNLVAWANYTRETEDEKSWVKPFEDETGCMVDPTYGNTSDEMVNLMRQNGGADFDGVSASGDATLRLIANGDVAPIDTSLFPEYPDMMGSLHQARPHNGRSTASTTACPTCGVPTT